MKKKTLNVKGMHCKSCEMLIREELEDTQVVNNINVSVDKGLIAFEYDQDKISLDKIKKIIEGEGYTVK